MRKKWLLILFLLAGSSSNAQPGGDDIVRVMRAYVDSQEIAGMFYIIANGGKILDQQGVGYSKISNKKKMDGDKLVWIASQSKPFAGVAVMMLVDEGKLSLDTPVTTYLPELNHLMIRRVNRDNVMVLEGLKQPVTLRQLLSHTSGMEFLAGVQKQVGKIDFLSISQSIYVTNLTPLAAEPGELSLYSNQGINIAGAIVERISGQLYEEFLRKRIFEPLGMKSITFWPSQKQMENMMVPYKKENGRLVETTIHYLQYPLDNRSRRFAEPGGGLFCTPKDLVKFYQMILNKGLYNGNRILSESAVSALGRKQTNEKLSYSYGLGWNVGSNFIGHGGAYGTDTKVYLKNGLIVMYFIQSAGLPKTEEVFESFEKTVKKIYGINNH